MQAAAGDGYSLLLGSGGEVYGVGGAFGLSLAAVATGTGPPTDDRFAANVVAGKVCVQRLFLGASLLHLLFESAPVFALN